MVAGLNATQLQIWRQTSPGSYRLTVTTSIDAVAFSSTLYEYTLATPMSVLSGDVLGIFVPSASSLFPVVASAENVAPYYYQFNPTIPAVTIPAVTISAIRIPAVTIPAVTITVTSLVLTSMMTVSSSLQVPLVTVEIMAGTGRGRRNGSGGGEHLLCSGV